MTLRVIEGGRSTLLESENPLKSTDAHKVRVEALRRLKEAGYEQYRVRSMATGQPIPRELKHFQMQIDLVAEKLAGLCPIPTDYTEDLYWPARTAKSADS
ncbi:hypothetical protein [Pararhizobium gei]|uniref:hypothetical protein n=1 Tax=Pararhizobium gei TaxID=1395951 RepID=UPI0023DBFDFD|nr:hypothetical protein [Rhizobium gei]